MDTSIWNSVDIHDAFCLECNAIMEYEGYEIGNELGKIINRETKNYLEMVFLDFKCPNCSKRTSIMSQ